MIIQIQFIIESILTSDLSNQKTLFFVEKQFYMNPSLDFAQIFYPKGTQLEARFA